MSLLKTILMFLMTVKLGKMDHTECETNHQHKIKENLDKFKMKRKEAFVVTPPFEMNNAIPKSLNDDDIITQDTNVHGKSFDDDVVTSIESNANYENIDQKDSNENNEYEARLPINDMMDVMNKQSQLVQKLAVLLQSKTNDEQNDKKRSTTDRGKKNDNTNSCNKVCKQSLRQEENNCVEEMTCFTTLSP